jgi:ferredoxin--NADP+ reductase
MDGYRIVRDRSLAEKIREYWIEAPMVAKKHRAGQFVIIRLHEHGERIPFTVVQTEAEKGLIRLISQSVGKTTEEFTDYHTGDFILDVVGPLGQATHVQNWGNLVVIGGRRRFGSSASDCEGRQSRRKQSARNPWRALEGPAFVDRRI